MATTTITRTLALTLLALATGAVFAQIEPSKTYRQWYPLGRKQKKQNDDPYTHLPMNQKMLQSDPYPHLPMKEKMFQNDPYTHLPMKEKMLQSDPYPHLPMKEKMFQNDPYTHLPMREKMFQNDPYTHLPMEARKQYSHWPGYRPPPFVLDDNILGYEQSSRKRNQKQLFSPFDARAIQYRRSSYQNENQNCDTLLQAQLQAFISQITMKMNFLQNSVDTLKYTLLMAARAGNSNGGSPGMGSITQPVAVFIRDQLEDVENEFKIDVMPPSQKDSQRKAVPGADDDEDCEDFGGDDDCKVTTKNPLQMTVPTRPVVRKVKFEEPIFPKEAKNATNDDKIRKVNQEGTSTEAVTEGISRKVIQVNRVPPSAFPGAAKEAAPTEEPAEDGAQRKGGMLLGREWRGGRPKFTRRPRPATTAASEAATVANGKDEELVAVIKEMEKDEASTTVQPGDFSIDASTLPKI